VYSELTLGVGQKCSALSRLYVPASLWNGEFKELLTAEVKKISVGNPLDFKHFMGPVMLVLSPDLSSGG
jgi:1-pyrroline-5-carboxylate dehydrogenase